MKHGNGYIVHGFWLMELSSWWIGASHISNNVMFGLFLHPASVITVDILVLKFKANKHHSPFHHTQ